MALSLSKAPDLARRRIDRTLDETGLLCVTFLEGIRRTWDLRQWWGEFIEQCWFLARVTSVPVMLIAVPLGATISLQVGDIARQLGAQSGTGALLVAAMIQQVAPLAAALLVSGVGSRPWRSWASTPSTAW
jgi:phospholipid/cholesterol/gamma-HCH transport system permease protein